MSYSAERKPHAVFTPYPLQGHINPLFKLAELLHLRGFHITFVNTDYNHKRYLKSRGPSAVEGLPDFRFESIPDGLPPLDADADGDVSQHIPSLCDSITKNCLQPFRELLARLNQSATTGLNPPVTCLVSDCFVTFPIQAAKELGIPVLLLSPLSAGAFWSFMHYRTLVERGIVPFKGRHI